MPEGLGGKGWLGHLSPEPPPSPTAPSSAGGAQIVEPPSLAGQKVATQFIAHILAKFSPGFYEHPISELYLPSACASGTAEESFLCFEKLTVVGHVSHFDKICFHIGSLSKGETGLLPWDSVSSVHN